MRHQDIFEIVDHMPAIDTLAEHGDKPDTFDGNVEFKVGHMIILSGAALACLTT